MKTVFIDSNIWIYAHVRADDEEKRSRALELLESSLRDSRIVSSVQVVNEFHWILERKYTVKKDVIARKVRSIIKIAHIAPVTITTYHGALQLRKDYKLSFWDSLIVASALENDAENLYSEDMQHGQTVRKRLTIRNPFIT